MHSSKKENGRKKTSKYCVSLKMIVYNSWLESRRNDDNAEGLWRVHDSLYDLNVFVNRHPGGADWIKLTKVIESINEGCDI